jgi:hypothetical protein
MRCKKERGEEVKLILFDKIKMGREILRGWN